jgi:hypothetical protein
MNKNAAAIDPVRPNTPAPNLNWVNGAAMRAIFSPQLSVGVGDIRQSYIAAEMLANPHPHISN